MLQKKANYSLPDMFGIGGTYLYIVAMLVGFPLFYKENLLNLIVNKKDYFKLFAILYGICLCPALIMWIRDLIQKKKKLELQSDLVFIGILAIALGLSLFFSVDREISFSETTYRSAAVDAFFMSMIGYLGIRVFGRYTSGTVGSWIIGSAWISVIGILCACQINYMNMQDQLSTKENFLTPLGNTNFSASYIGLVLPLAFVMYMLCKERISKVIYSVVLYAGFMFAIFNKTQSSVMSVLAIFFLALYFAIEKEEWFVRYINAIGIFILATTTIYYIVIYYGERVYPLEGMGAVFTKGKMIAAQWIVYIAFRLLLNWKKDRLRSLLFRWRKQILYVVIGVIALGLLSIVLVNFCFREAVVNSPLQSLLFYHESFNNRVVIWHATLDLLKQSSLRELLFGQGLQCYETVIQPVGGELLSQYFGYTIKDPHNEFFQTVVEMGILGVVGYFGLMIMTLVQALRNWKNNPIMIVAIVSVASYLIQGLVNCYALTHLPILFILLGLCNGAMQKFNTSNSSSHVLF